jgi:serine O-acetyltransferase
MKLEDTLDQQLPEILRGLEHCWNCPIGANTERGLNLAGQQAVHRLVDHLISLLFPGCHDEKPIRDSEMPGLFKDRMVQTALELREQAKRAYQYQCELEHCKACDTCGSKADDAVSHLIRSLPGIQRLLQQDIMAAYEGDPAARSVMEVVMSYPGVYATIVHRVAHLLYEKGMPLIPRIMSEYAHSRTGIDIHPGAQIGPGFFIDHGTGVVIGETCVIGHHVKLYQGVTLGALSFEKDEQGRLVKGIKRHPEVGDNVVIYAGATILGGKTIIGAGSEIGGNVWLVHSVPPGSKVYNQQPRPLIKEKNGGLGTSDGAGI